jgi:hypothetical protein
MSPLRSGFQPKSVILSAARFCVIGATVVSAGCAANKEPSYVRGPGLQQHAAVPIPKAEMEDDGQPVQSPPARAMKAEEDDPTQPWSPNYGKPDYVAPARPTKPAFDNSQPAQKQVDASLRPSLVASSRGLRVMSDDEVDALQQAAIAAHEMRNR